MIKLKASFGFFVAAVVLAPTTIVAVQWLTRGSGPEPKTSAGSIVPGALIVLWGIAAGMKRERVVVDAKARTIAWVTTTFGVRYRVVSWPWDEVTGLHVAINNNTLRSAGRRADAVGPRRRRTVFYYFHRRPPESVVQLAKLLGVPVVDDTDRARHHRERAKSE